MLALWIALIGADRIDLAGGHGAFVLTPFLALTPLVLVTETVRRWRERSPIVLSRFALSYSALAAALLAVVLISVFPAEDVPSSASRTMLLFAHVIATLAVALLCSDRRDLMRVLATGAAASLVLFVVFDIYEAAWFAGRGPELLRLGTLTARFDRLQIIGPFPRLAGPVADSNRAGLVLVIYMVFMANAGWRPWVRRVMLGLATLLVLGAVSRSATLAAFATLAVSFATRETRVPLRFALGAALIGAAAVGYLLWRPSVLDRAATIVASPLAGRLSTSEGSATSHLHLIVRGLDEATKSVQRATTGLGYGNAYLVLQDLFPANRYGNFHSLYVTMFAESGVFALILMLALMAVPLAVDSPWRALVAGTVAFNLFYQTTTEPAFWFVLAMAWLSLRATSSKTTALSA